MNYNIAKKIDGKYRTVMSLKDGEYGLQFSINRKLFVELLKDPTQEWLNFAVFDNSEDEKKDVKLKEVPKDDNNEPAPW